MSVPGLVWPSPTEWVASLADTLADLDTVFLALESVRCGASPFTESEEAELNIPSDAQPEMTHQYARVLTRLVEALGQMPPFQDGRGLVALRALRLDLTALDGGNKPARLQPRKGVSNGADNIGRRAAKANAVLAVRLLQEIGMGQTAALDRVSKIFANAGHRGKQGGPLSSKTLDRWVFDVVSANKTSADATGRRFADRQMAEWKADPAWPVSEEDGLAFISRLAANPVFSLAHTT